MTDETKNEETAEEPKKRIFKYRDQTYDDPGPEYTVDDVKKHLAGIFPEINQAEVEEKETDGALEITFIKRAGTKG